MVPTSVPNTLWGSLLHSKAAIGAQMSPPTIKPRITVQLNRSGPIKIMKVVVSETVTKNSAKFTEPTALLGSTLFVTSVVVAIGPHPPPPKASRKAATYPNGTSILEDGRSSLKRTIRFKANLRNISRPMKRSMPPTTNCNISELRLTATKAPIEPPMTPGTVKCRIISLRTFPSLKCDVPEARVVKISAVWTLALARAG